jgi:hypothetical protein
LEKIFVFLQIDKIPFLFCGIFVKNILFVFSFEYQRGYEAEKQSGARARGSG